MIVKIVGFSAAFLTMFGFLPQVIKIYKTKSVKDISLLALLQFTLGISLWLVYGIMLSDPVIILANSVTLAILIVAVSLYAIYHGKERRCTR